MWLFSKNWVLHIEFETKNGNVDYLEESYSKHYWNFLDTDQSQTNPPPTGHQRMIQALFQGQRWHPVVYAAYALIPAVCIPSRWTVQILTVWSTKLWTNQNDENYLAES